MAALSFMLLALSAKIMTNLKLTKYSAVHKQLSGRASVLFHVIRCNHFLISILLSLDIIFEMAGLPDLD